MEAFWPQFLTTAIAVDARDFPRREVLYRFDNDSGIIGMPVSNPGDGFTNSGAIGSVLVLACLMDIGLTNYDQVPLREYTDISVAHLAS